MTMPIILYASMCLLKSNKLDVWLRYDTSTITAKIKMPHTSHLLNNPTKYGVILSTSEAETIPSHKGIVFSFGEHQY